MNKKLVTSKIVYIILFILTIGIVFNINIQKFEAKAACDCSGASQEWNKAGTTSKGHKIVSPPFGFKDWDHDKMKDDYVYLKPSTCEYSNGQRCVREADCGKANTALSASNGWECLPSQGSGWESIPYHCSGNSGSICQRKNDSAPKAVLPDSPPVLPKKTVAAPTVTRDVVVLNNCCKEILPRVQAGAGERYQLNHLVQVGVNVYQCILCIIGALVLLFFVIGGVVLLTSAGNSAQVEKGKKMIVGAAIGAIIVFASVLIVTYFVNAIGGNITDQDRITISSESK